MTSLTKCNDHSTVRMEGGSNRHCYIIERREKWIHPTSCGTLLNGGSIPNDATTNRYMHRTGTLVESQVKGTWLVVRRTPLLPSFEKKTLFISW
jgi:hypothetical protein